MDADEIIDILGREYEAGRRYYHRLMTRLTLTMLIPIIAALVGVWLGGSEGRLVIIGGAAVAGWTFLGLVIRFAGLLEIIVAGTSLTQERAGKILGSILLFIAAEAALCMYLLIVGIHAAALEDFVIAMVALFTATTVVLGKGWAGDRVWRTIYGFAILVFAWSTLAMFPSSFWLGTVGYDFRPILRFTSPINSELLDETKRKLREQEFRMKSEELAQIERRIASSRTPQQLTRAKEDLKTWEHGSRGVFAKLWEKLSKLSEGWLTAIVIGAFIFVVGTAASYNGKPAMNKTARHLVYTYLFLRLAFWFLVEKGYWYKFAELL